MERGGQFPNRILVIQDNMIRRDAQIFRAHVAPQGMWDIRTNAPKLLAKQQKYGDSPVRMIVPGLLEKSRLRITDGRRQFVAVDNYAAVKVGDLEREAKSKKVVKPKFTTDFPRAVIREGAGELTLRAHEGVARTFSSTPRMCEIKDGDRRQLTRTCTPSARSFFKESKDQSVKPMFYRYKDLHQGVKKQDIGRKQEG